MCQALSKQLQTLFKQQSFKVVLFTPILQMRKSKDIEQGTRSHRLANGRAGTTTQAVWLQSPHDQEVPHPIPHARCVAPSRRPALPAVSLTYSESQ